jgi:hypothetical protein
MSYQKSGMIWRKNDRDWLTVKNNFTLLVLIFFLRKLFLFITVMLAEYQIKKLF